MDMCGKPLRNRGSMSFAFNVGFGFGKNYLLGENIYLRLA